ncbi:MAG: hypothetical protein KGI29_06675 [Pseudomonadota bacterium]|nr:hypothetical protein [Pseudomonadota bacterium]MDE3037554.1 hypothetical protein [Pseudomonadota bacterium]
MNHGITFGPGGGSDNNRDGSTGVMVPGSGTVMDDAGNIYPADSSLPKPDGIPDDWGSKPTQSREGTPNGGMRYFDPNNPKNDVRVMPGKPDGEYPSQQQPYVRWNLDGQALDANGNAVPAYTEDAHIPLDEFEFLPEIFP